MKRLGNLLTRDMIEKMDEAVHVHQFNDQAIRHTRSIGDALGLSRIGVHLVRVEPGHDTTRFHFHHCDEEFVYILSGQGEARIGDETVAVTGGDFMAFPANSPAHSMRNTSTEDLVYLMGGSREAIDICDYPEINRRMYREHGRKQYVSLDDLHDVPRR
ncbi:MAG: cupin domain-containing protein [Proteobacteria bacterium]|nr:cupin domain-containing protein [Pseudomonadota bacterium]